VSEDVLGKVKIAFERPDGLRLQGKLGDDVVGFGLPSDGISKAALAPLVHLLHLAAVFLDESMDAVNGGGQTFIADLRGYNQYQFVVSHVLLAVSGRSAGWRRTAN
jgi:hypothetical protein